MRLAAVLLLLANTALGASLGGRATSSNAPLANVTVTAWSDMLPQPRVTRTAANGAYAIEELPAGTYNVMFALAGHQTITRQAVVHAGDRTRVDADLQPSEEGESVTLTAGARSVLQRPASVWSLDRDTAEDLPLGRSVGEYLLLGPSFVREGRVDGMITDAAPPPEAAAETAMVFAGLPVEVRYESAHITSPTARTFFGSLRETIEGRSGDTTAHHEASIGGLNLFAAGHVTEVLRTAYAKGTFAPTAHDTVTASLLTSEFADEQFGATWVHAREFGSMAITLSDPYIATRSHAFVAGAHELAAGFERFDDRNAYFVRDRWSIGTRTVLEGGLRLDDGMLMPRAGAVVDVGGETRVAATWARTFEGDQLALTAARPLGAHGYARGTIADVDGELAGFLDGEWHWLLLRFGGAAQFREDFTTANAWVMLDPPLPGHDVNVSLLQRYGFGDSFTDLAINYALPRDRVTPFAHLDVVNVFEERVWRVGLGVRWK
jgi:hypothetical protein